MSHNVFPASSFYDRATFSIVVADRHAIFRSGIRLAIETRENYAVVAEAASVATVLESVLRERPHLLLLAFRLADGSALDVLRRLRDMELKVPVILVATAIERAQVMLALQLGARGVLLKDVAPDVLLRAIDAVLRGELWISRGMLADYADYLSSGGRTLLAVTTRERQIIDCILEGKTNREIGQQLGIAEDTVKRHITHIFDKLGVSSRLELALFITDGKLAATNS